MPSLFNTYRFTVNDGTGDTLVYPINSGLRRRYEREGDTRSYRVKLSTKLLFKGADYTYFREIYDAGECNEVSILIENYCGGAWVTWHEGIVPIYDGDYKADRCEVSFDINPADVYECANKAFEVRENWLQLVSGANIVPVKVSQGVLETITCVDSGTSTALSPDVPQFYKGCWGTGYTTSSDPDPLLAWKPIAHHQEQFYVGTSIDPDIIAANTTWAREKITSATPPAGAGWINLSGTTWVRPVNTMAVVQNYKQIRDTVAIDTIDWESQAINAAPISNGRKLSAVLEAVTATLDCGFDSIVSNFFNINPDATAPTNDAYTYATDNFLDVFFYQKSDIVRASASNDTTRFTFSMKEFLEEIKLLHLFYAITISGGLKKLRIEHYTYFDGANGLDLTTLDGGKHIVGRDDFKTDSKVPNFESFSWQESYRPKFLTKRITYPAACATVQGDERTARQLCTDFGGLIENPDAGLEGFFLMATVDLGGGEYLMNTLGGEANGAFAWENILPALWADGRFHAGATANVPGYTVNSVRKTREQAQISIPFCCEEVFEPSELVQTQLGWGEVKSAEYDTETATLTLSLLQ